MNFPSGPDNKYQYESKRKCLRVAPFKRIVACYSVAEEQSEPSPIQCVPDADEILFLEYTELTLACPVNKPRQEIQTVQMCSSNHNSMQTKEPNSIIIANCVKI